MGAATGVGKYVTSGRRVTARGAVKAALGGAVAGAIGGAIGFGAGKAVGVALKAVSGAISRGAVAKGSATELHHTVPRQILKALPEHVRGHPLVRGRAGAPNRWAIPTDMHRAIHSGPGPGGAYTQAWRDALGGLGRDPGVDDILQLRGQITKQFGIDIYNPF